ncbi:TPA: hypothetical protein U1Z56_000069 [Streptococcus suis]|nr:hypothetical protein [Streptococcus suis]HEM4595886.1 hypothetical protein [Streptococcus suis]
MYSLIEITTNRENMKKLPITETQALKKGDFYKFYYFLPFDTYMTGFIYQGLMVTIVKDYPKEADRWELVRDKKIAMINKELLEKMEKLERNNLDKMRVNIDYIYTPMLTELLKSGVNSRADVAYLVRELYINGMDMMGAIEIFANLTQRSDLASYFLQVATSFFEGMTV